MCALIMTSILLFAFLMIGRFLDDHYEHGDEYIDRAEKRDNREDLN